MSTKRDSVAEKAAKAVKAARHTTSSHGADRLKAEVRKQAMHVASLACTTVAFVAMVIITLGADAFVQQQVFAWFHVKPESVLVDIFKYAKYAALVVELAFWVYGIYKDCRDHAKD